MARRIARRSVMPWSLQRRPIRGSPRGTKRERAPVSSRGRRQRCATLMRLAHEAEQGLEVPVETSRTEVAGQTANPCELGAPHGLLILRLEQVDAAGRGSACTI